VGGAAGSNTSIFPRHRRCVLGFGAAAAQAARAMAPGVSVYIDVLRTYRSNNVTGEPSC